ncbi:MAG: hypothetical protein WCI04_00335 [archaeon]
MNDQLNLKRLQKAKKLVQSGAKYEIGSNNINIVTGDNRALTLYFDEVKKVVPVSVKIKDKVYFNGEMLGKIVNNELCVVVDTIGSEMCEIKDKYDHRYRVRNHL